MEAPEALPVCVTNSRFSDCATQLSFSRRIKERDDTKLQAMRMILF